MCNKINFECLLLFLAGFLLFSGVCQNAEPARRSLGPRSFSDENYEQLREEIWASPEGEKMLEDERAVKHREEDAAEAEVAPRGGGNRKGGFFPLETTGKSFLQSRRVNVTSLERRRKKRRRNKFSSRIEETPKNREDEVNIDRSRSSKNRSNSRRSRNRVRESFRRELRRRLRNKIRFRNAARSPETRKFERRQNVDPLAHLLGNASRVTNEEKENFSNPQLNLDADMPSKHGMLKNLWNAGKSGTASNSSSFPVDSRIPEPAPPTPLETESRYLQNFLPDKVPEKVEREFSRHMEREISKLEATSYNKSPTEVYDFKSEFPSFDERYRKPSKPEGYGKAPFDPERMLGYSRTDEDLPILDLENQVLRRTLNDYNAYMSSSLIIKSQGAKDDEPRDKEPSDMKDQRWTDQIIESKPTTEADDSTESDYEDEYHVDSLILDENLKGDLSCINGTFIPAPVVEHALIKYVKSSIPNQEYIEAEYECTPGYYMSTNFSTLLCRNRQWVGQTPKCNERQYSDGLCTELRCEQICKIADFHAKCFCFDGFHLDGHKCTDDDECEESNGGCEFKCVNTPGSYRCECPAGMRQGEDKYSCTDIDECLPNEGRGSCQDTCRNLEGGYECTCDGIPGTILSPDNHTCLDAGPCSYNNAGCSHTCLATMGRVFCLCPDGYMLEDDWKTCQDINECAVPDLQTEACQYGCINTPGSYRCAEFDELKEFEPFVDDTTPDCQVGFQLSPEKSCIDINECEADNGGCSEVCENTRGSFFCACDGDERILSSDGRTCSDLTDINCPPLNPSGRGYIMCSKLDASKTRRGRRRVITRPGTKCFLKCPHGYQLHGEYDLTCRSDGTWDGPKQGECVKYGKPRLDCPQDVIAELPAGRDEAFITFDQPSTDLDWFRYVRSKPSWGTRLEANLKPGLHEITFYARHPVSKKQTSCTLRITVKDGEAPTVKECPDDIEVSGNNGTEVTWPEPVFSDNVKVTRVTSNESSGRPFSVGEHRVEYEASDEAGWTTKCIFTVVLRQA